MKESLANEKELKAIDDIVNTAKKKAKIEFIDKQYNPDELTKKLTEQLQGMQQEMNKQNKAKQSKK